MLDIHWDKYRSKWQWDVTSYSQGWLQILNIQKETITSVDFFFFTSVDLMWQNWSPHIASHNWSDLAHIHTYCWQHCKVFWTLWRKVQQFLKNLSWDLDLPWHCDSTPQYIPNKNKKHMFIEKFVHKYSQEYYS